MEEAVERIRRLEIQARQLKIAVLSLAGFLVFVGVSAISFGASSAGWRGTGTEFMAPQIVQADLPQFGNGKLFIGTAQGLLQLSGDRRIQWTKNCPPQARPDVPVEMIPGGLDPQRAQNLPAAVSMVWLCFG